MPPIVILTSNRTRELAEALRRRCVYHWIAYPDASREAAIIAARAPGVAEATAAAVARAVSAIRARPLAKPPGISESVEWANAATVLEKGGSPWPEAFRRAIGVLIKDEEDLALMREALPPHSRGGAGVTVVTQERTLMRLPRECAPFLDFVHILRRHGFSVSPDQTETFFSAITLLGPGTMEHIRRAAIATLAPPIDRMGRF